MAASTNQAFDIGLHQDLQHRLGNGSQKIAIAALLQQVNKRHFVVGHRVLGGLWVKWLHLHLSRTFPVTTRRSPPRRAPCYRALRPARAHPPNYRMARPSSSGVTLAGQPKERSGAMQIAILGVDLGKNSCSVVGLDAAGHVVLRRRLRRDGVIKLAAGMPGCVMAMEACCGAHHLGRLLRPGSPGPIDVAGVCASLCQSSKERRPRCRSDR